MMAATVLARGDNCCRDKSIAQIAADRCHCDGGARLDTGSETDIAQVRYSPCIYGKFASAADVEANLP
jgi:hypothetical protein